MLLARYLSKIFHDYEKATTAELPPFRFAEALNIWFKSVYVFQTQFFAKSLIQFE